MTNIGAETGAKIREKTTREEEKEMLEKRVGGEKREKTVFKLRGGRVWGLKGITLKEDLSEHGVSQLEYKRILEGSIRGDKKKPKNLRLTLEHINQSNQQEGGQ